MPISHSQTIATKGVLHNNNAVTFGTKGYIYLLIEEIPIPPKKRGRGPAKLGASKLKKEPKKPEKLIKVTVKYDGRTYIEAKKVSVDTKVTSDDVSITNLGDVIKISINVDGVKIDNKDIDSFIK